MRSGTEMSQFLRIFLPTFTIAFQVLISSICVPSMHTDGHTCMTSPVSAMLSHISSYRHGPGCSKLTTSLVNVSLKFQMLISEVCHYFLLKKCEKLLHCKSFSHFFNKKYQYIL